MIGLLTHRGTIIDCRFSIIDEESPERFVLETDRPERAI